MVKKDIHDLFDYLRKYINKIYEDADKLYPLLKKDAVFNDIENHCYFDREKLIEKIKSKESEFTKLWFEIRNIVKEITSSQSCIARLLYIFTEGKFITDEYTTFTLEIRFHKKLHEITYIIELLERCNFLSFSTLFFWYAKEKSQFFRLIDKFPDHLSYVTNDNFPPFFTPEESEKINQMVIEKEKTRLEAFREYVPEGLSLKDRIEIGLEAFEIQNYFEEKSIKLAKSWYDFTQLFKIKLNDSSTYDDVKTAVEGLQFPQDHLNYWDEYYENMLENKSLVNGFVNNSCMYLLTMIVKATYSIQSGWLEYAIKNVKSLNKDFVDKFKQHFCFNCNRKLDFMWTTYEEKDCCLSCECILKRNKLLY